MNSEPETLPALPPVKGARYVSRTESADGYGAVGFRDPAPGSVRCMIPNGDSKAPGAVFAWNGRRWEIESGGLSGAALRSWNRYSKGSK